MRRSAIRSRLWLLTLVGGGTLFALEGCDATVRDTVLTGVGTAATSLSATFIDAFVKSLLADDEEETATTVKADTNFAPQIFA